MEHGRLARVPEPRLPRDRDGHRRPWLPGDQLLRDGKPHRIGGHDHVPVTLLNQPTPTYSFSDTETNGQLFTAQRNLLVTDFIHYYGTKVSLWTSTGTLLASQTYSSTPGLVDRTRL